MKKISILILFFLLLLCHGTNGAPMVRDLHTESLPDGSSISYYSNGDERLYYTLSPDGYVLMKNENGYYTYAQKDDKDYLVAGNIVAHDEKDRTKEEISYLKTITPYLTYHPDQLPKCLDNIEKTSFKAQSLYASSDNNTNPNSQMHKRNLVILVEPSDVSFTIENPVEKFHNLLNEEDYNYNGATGSVRDYFIESSSGAYQPDFDVIGPYKVSSPTSYYARNDNFNMPEMVIEVCQKACEDGVDFSLYATNNNLYVDNICIIYAGKNKAETGGGSYIHPYNGKVEEVLACNGKIISNFMCTSELRMVNTNTTEICGIGTFVHEFSHILGLPDFYYTGIGSAFCLDEWDVMDYGLYSNKGRTPPSFSSYERFFMGWLTPEILTDATTNITLPELISSNKAYIISKSTPDLNGYNPAPNEFFLLENRQQKGSDAYLPNHGMIIWHINYDKNSWNKNIVNNGTPQKVYLVPADGSHTSGSKGGDSFPNTSKKDYYSPFLWDNTNLDKPITNITESNEIIIFNFGNNAFSELESANTNAINVWSINNTLFISGIKEETKLQVIGIDGKIIQEKILTGTFNELHIHKTGIYIMQLKSANYSSSFKIFLSNN